VAEQRLKRVTQRQGLTDVTRYKVGTETIGGKTGINVGGQKVNVYAGGGRSALMVEGGEVIGQKTFGYTAASEKGLRPPVQVGGKSFYRTGSVTVTGGQNVPLSLTFKPVSKSQVGGARVKEVEGGVETIQTGASKTITTRPFKSGGPTLTQTVYRSRTTPGKISPDTRGVSSGAGTKGIQVSAKSFTPTELAAFYNLQSGYAKSLASTATQIYGTQTSASVVKAGATETGAKGAAVPSLGTTEEADTAEAKTETKTETKTKTKAGTTTQGRIRQRFSIKAPAREKFTSKLQPTAVTTIEGQTTATVSDTTTVADQKEKQKTGLGTVQQPGQAAIQQPGQGITRKPRQGLQQTPKTALGLKLKTKLAQAQKQAGLGAQPAQPVTTMTTTPTGISVPFAGGFEPDQAAPSKLSTDERSGPTIKGKERKPLADWIGATRVEFEYSKATTPKGKEKDPITGTLKPVEEKKLDFGGKNLL